MAVAQLSPRSETLAYRIWAIANPRGWDLTLRELADELGEGLFTVNSVCIKKGWSGRLRVMTPDTQNSIGWFRGNAPHNAEFGVGEMA